MGPRWEQAESMLNSSQRVRDELAAAVGRLDSYIELLKLELAKRDTKGEDNEPAGG